MVVQTASSALLAQQGYVLVPVQIVVRIQLWFLYRTLEHWTFCHQT